MKIRLASQSPRRKEILSALGYPFETVSIDCEEIYPETLPAEEVAAYLSLLKSSVYKNLQSDEVLITADTIVAIDGEILGKPKNEEDARQMLRKLSGKTHRVYTAVTIKTTEKTVTETDVSEVDVDVLSDEEICQYIRECKPMDKAGSYGVQEWFGMAKISAMRGSFYTVMGLPSHLVYKILKDIEVS